MERGDPNEAAPTSCRFSIVGGMITAMLSGRTGAVTASVPSSRGGSILGSTPWDGGSDTGWVTAAVLSVSGRLVTGVCRPVGWLGLVGVVIRSLSSSWHSRIDNKSGTAPGLDHGVGHVWALRVMSESSDAPCSCQDDTRLCPLYL